MPQDQPRPASIVLVPGAWLGAWAWDEVVELLQADGHQVSAITLPGLESVDADRSSVTLDDHVEAICDAVRAATPPVVLAVHSVAGFSGYAASDRVPELIARMVYVDSAPGKGAVDPQFEGVEKPLDWEEIEAEENLDGLTDEHISRFRARAVPEPAAIFRENVPLTNEARRDVPTTIICSGFPSEEIQAAASKGWAWLAGVPEVRDITWLDLPTSHWPMWSRPRDLADLLGQIAVESGEVADRG